LLTYSQDKLDALRTGLKPLTIDLPDNKLAIGLTYRKDQALTRAQATFVKIMSSGRP
jgi:hypothetical protein